MVDIESNPPREPARLRTINILLGVLFLIPAVLACGVSQLALSIGTLVTSLQKSSLLTAPEFIGLDNYVRLFQDKTALGAFGFSWRTGLARLLLVAILPPLLAWGINGLNRWLREALRVFFSIPVVMCAPVVIALMWGIILAPGAALGDQHWLVQPTQAQQFLLFLDGVYTLGLAFGLGLVFYLAVFRGLEPGQSPWKPLLPTWGIGLLAAIASALQSFTLSYVLTAGGPINATTNIVLYLYRVSFQFAQFGMGSAVAAVLLVLLAVLGLIAGLIAVLSGLKIQLTSDAHAKAISADESGVATEKSSGRIVALIMALLIGLLTVCLGLVPLLAVLGTALKGMDLAKLLELIPPGRTLLNTFMPPIISVLFIQVPLTWLAAFGIGALRPMGRHSEWLLLPFCPWLLTGLTPLSLYAYQLARGAGLLNTFIALIPPVGVSIPMLLLLTLFFKGQAQTLKDSGFKAYLTHFILPSLPLLVVLAGAGVFVSVQDPFWGLIFATKAEMYPLNNILMTLHGGYTTSTPLIANALLWVETPILLFFFVAFAIFQVFYLKRLSISTATEPRAK